ncbi:serine hydroxymethyltransferase-domain-containing protein [Fimicolochytrium jonesii]|uniref:serine hydroxymethyltransferase-domain-containing protein n=1 Tax=Fimicolochytrium jonesii TaxID=1396493 RepID=UPI0022FE4709|nr:serine hydroxymethyltransferase-domain-containing protein [Fimicolochytrium jonesii]KAI8827150.1 serine hydroxymethyltransferase-domain-containing protein [Fimicolochytrium jonesii]
MLARSFQRARVRNASACLLQLAKSKVAVVQTTAPMVRSVGRREFTVTCATKAQPVLNEPLEKTDPEVFSILKKEMKRQTESIVLIPSENFTSRSVMQAVGSVMQNKYSEGYPGARYYGGNEFIDMAETLCQKRALEVFGLDPEKWGVNVQALSGAPANLYVYSALMKPHERLMGLDLPHGGHLSHGYQTDTKKISAVSTYFETMPYRVDENTGLVDYDMLQKTATLYRPKILVAGASAYARNWDYERMRKIADSVNAYLLADMAHVSGLVAAGVLPSPFEHSDIVTTTTHKSLRGPRGAMIFYRKGVRKVNKKGAEILYDLESPINFSVFPGHQGGPHNHTITGLAVALKHAQQPEFKEYQNQVLKNAKQFENSFRELGYDMVSGGTDTHLLLLDLRSKNIDGARVERVLELANIASNKNTVPGDKSALIPFGLRIGSPAMTSRNLTEPDFAAIAQFIHRGVEITRKVAQSVNSKKLVDFKKELGEGEKVPELQQLKKEVVEFAKRFPTVGYEL